MHKFREKLDLGEAEAIALAIVRRADLLLVDGVHCGETRNNSPDDICPRTCAAKVGTPGDGEGTKTRDHRALFP